MNQLMLSGVEVEVLVESLPIVLKGYAGFWILVGIGCVVTKLRHHLSVDYDAPNYGYDSEICDTKLPLLYDKVECEKQSLLVKFFGYNNICFYFDLAPANYFLPFFYAATMCCFLLYLFLEWMRYKLTNKANKLSNYHYNLLTRLKWFEAFAFLFFSTIFAVSPVDDTTMRVHSIPFVVFQLGLVSTVFSNFFHGKWSNCYEEEFGTAHPYIRWRWRYAVAFTVIVIVKMTCQIYALVYISGANKGPLNNEPLKDQQGALVFVQIIDLLFLLFAAILPFFFGVWYLRAKGKTNKRYMTKITFEPVWKDRSDSTSSIKSVAHEVSSILMGLPEFHGNTMSEEDQLRAYELFQRLDSNGTGFISTADIERTAGRSRRVSMAYYGKTSRNRDWEKGDRVRITKGRRKGEEGVIADPDVRGLVKIVCVR
jgi:hypothetical protein